MTDGERTGRGVVRGQLSKDQLVLSMLAVLGGEHRDVSERDLFLACWHAFPNAMRWADTALPNPDTFTAALRRLDADSLVARTGKQVRRAKTRAAKRPALEIGRSNVVRARVTSGGLARGGITPDDVRYVAALVAEPSRYQHLEPGLLVAVALGIREADGRTTDEGLLVETAFHKFPAVFAYRDRPEFPDTQAVRAGLRDARASGLLTGYQLTAQGQQAVEAFQAGATLRVDASVSHSTGAFKLAERIESTPAYGIYVATGSLSATKGDELFRALRLPPTTDTNKIVAVLENYSRELRRIDKGEVVSYLTAVAKRHNPDVTSKLGRSSVRLSELGDDE